MADETPDALDDASIPFESFASAHIEDSGAIADPVTKGDLRERGADAGEPRATAEPPKAEPAPVKPQPFEAPRPTAGQPTEPPATDPKRFKVKGRDYTLQELAKSPELLEDLAVSWGKQARLEELRAQDQQKYTAVLERILAAKDQAAAGRPEGQQEDPKELSRLVRQTYTPDHLAERIVNGDMGPDWQEFAEMNPSVAAWAFYQADIVTALGHELARLSSWARGSMVGSEVEQYRQARDSAMEKLAGSDDLFAWLKDDGERKGFLEYLERRNPDASQVTDLEGLAELAIGFKKALIVAENRAARERAAQTGRAREQRAGAPPRSGGSRPVGTGAVPSGDPVGEQARDQANFDALAAMGRGR